MELTVEDLMQKCSTCNGSGLVERQREHQGSFGSRTVYASPVDCSGCNGTGWKLTETGKAIGKLMTLINQKPELKQLLYL